MCSRSLKTRWPKVRGVSNTASAYLKPGSSNGTRTSGSGTKRPLKYAMRAPAFAMALAPCQPVERGRVVVSQLAAHPRRQVSHLALDRLARIGPDAVGVGIVGRPQQMALAEEW